MDPLVKIVDLYKSFGSLEVLKGISTTVEKGEKLSIIGPSGSGKTTLAKIITKNIECFSIQNPEDMDNLKK